MTGQFWKRKRLLDSIVSTSKEVSFLPADLENRAVPGIVSFVNPYSYLKVLESNFPLDGIIYAIDGSLLILFHNFFRRDSISRLSFDFTSMAGQVFEECQRRNLSIGLIGGKPGEVDLAERNIKEIYPNLLVTYRRHGYFNDDEREPVLNEIRSLRPDVLICGMGTPRQEEFLIAGREISAFRWSYTCGGFISQTAERGHYYPDFVMRFGLRWIYRFYRHGYVRKRVLFDYPRFVFLYLRGQLRRKA